MIVNYSNCLFVILSVVCFVYAAPAEEDAVGVPNEEPRRYYSAQYPYGASMRQDGPIQYASPFVPPAPTNVDSGVYYLVDLVRPTEKNPTETNEINNGDEGLVSLLLQQDSGNYRNYYPDREGDRKKRDVENNLESELKLEDIPETSQVGKLRKKRTFCRKCGGGYYRPMVYPVYGGGGGCNYCGGGGRPSYGGGGFGGGGSFSQSSAQSSSSSWGYGKK